MSAAAAGAATTIQAAAPYWRAAGLTYVAYANACAVHLRNCMKEPFKTQAATREKVHFKYAEWVDGFSQKPTTLTVPSAQE